MKTLTRLAALAVAAVSLLALPGAAEASDVRMGLGADYWRDRGYIFQANLGFEAQVAGPMAMGVRFGAMYQEARRDFGIPADLVIRFNFEQGFYMEGLAGVWTVVRENRPFNSHFAGGFGVQGKSVSLGLEVGLLEKEITIGPRLVWHFH